MNDIACVAYMAHTACITYVAQHIGYMAFFYIYIYIYGGAYIVYLPYIAYMPYMAYVAYIAYRGSKAYIA